MTPAIAPPLLLRWLLDHARTLVAQPSLMGVPSMPLRRCWAALDRDGLGRGEDGTVRLAFLETRAVVAAMAFVALHPHVPDRYYDLRPVVLAYVHEHIEKSDLPCPEADITALLSRGHGLSAVECKGLLEALCERGVLVSVTRPRRRGVFYRTVE